MSQPGGQAYEALRLTYTKVEKCCSHERARAQKTTRPEEVVPSGRLSSRPIFRPCLLIRAYMAWQARTTSSRLHP